MPRILEHLGASLLVSTDQVGKLVAVVVGSGELELSYYNFEKAMDIAVCLGEVAVGAWAAIWFLHDDPKIVRSRSSQPGSTMLVSGEVARVTGEIQGHELTWLGEELWVVNTAFSCLCTLDERHSFRPRWKPKFIPSLVAEDRCHSNGPACAEREEAGHRTGRYRPTGRLASVQATSILIDVESGETLVRGLAMPHSPRIHQGRRGCWGLGPRPACGG